jgi:hypothetical protein
MTRHLRRAQSPVDFAEVCGQGSYADTGDSSTVRGTVSSVKDRWGKVCRMILLQLTGYISILIRLYYMPDTPTGTKNLGK